MPRAPARAVYHGPGASGDQAQLAGPGDGLGPVGRAELAQDMADVLLDGVESDHKLGCWVDGCEIGPSGQSTGDHYEGQFEGQNGAGEPVLSSFVTT